MVGKQITEESEEQAGIPHSGGPNPSIDGAIMANRYQLIAAWSLVLLIVALTILRIYKTMVLTSFSGSEATFLSLGANLLQGRLAFDLYGDLFGYSQYFLHYPPGYSALTAGVFKVVGVSYHAAKLLPLVFGLLNLGVVYLVARRRFGWLEAVVACNLVALDPLYFRYSTINRPEMVIIFLFTLAFVVYDHGETTCSPRWLFVAGVLSGLAFLTSLNALWVVLAVGLWRLITGRLWREWRGSLSYFLAFGLTIAPYYAWILLSPERNRVFFDQLAFTGFVSGSPGWRLYLKKALNPVADLYLMLFRHQSFYPIALLVAGWGFLQAPRRWGCWLVLFTVALGMMVFTQRAARYLLITFPLCALGVAQAIHWWRMAPGASWLTRRVLIGGITIFGLWGLLNLGAITRFALAEPGLPLDVPYYREVFERYTPSDARIVTDSALVLSRSERRTIISVGTLILEHFRPHYTYGEIVSILDPDFIILTERKKQWGDQDHPQTVLFKELLQREFSEPIHVSDGYHSDLWIYKRLGYASLNKETGLSK